MPFKLVGGVGNSGVMLREVVFSVDKRLKVGGDKVAEHVAWNERGLDVGWWAVIA